MEKVTRPALISVLSEFLIMIDSDQNELGGYSMTNCHGPKICCRVVVSDDNGKTNLCLSSKAHEMFGKTLGDFFPVELFFGKKTGDTITINVGCKPLVLELISGIHGSFEQLLYNLTDQSITHRLDNKEGLNIFEFLDIHEAYAKSMGFEVIHPVIADRSAYSCYIDNRNKSSREKKTIYEQISEYLSDFLNPFT